MLQTNVPAPQPATPEASAQAPRASENANGPVNNNAEAAPTGQQQPAEVREKKRTAKGNNGIVTKGRGSRGAGWTGAGFDVDGRT